MCVGVIWSGADVNAQGGTGQTALMAAALGAHFTVSKLLLQNGKVLFFSKVLLQVDTSMVVQHIIRLLHKALW